MNNLIKQFAYNDYYNEFSPYISNTPGAIISFPFEYIRIQSFGKLPQWIYDFRYREGNIYNDS